MDNQPVKYHNDGDLYSAKFDLLEWANNQSRGSNSKMMDNRNVVDIDNFLSNKCGILILGCFGFGISLVAFGSIALIMGMAKGWFTVLLGLAGCGLSVLGEKIFKNFDFRRLNISMNSRNPKKRAYYVNRVLHYSLTKSGQGNALMDDPNILGYTLWLHETSIQLQVEGNTTRFYRKFFKIATMHDFREDIHHDLYLKIARDMVSGILRKKPIPISGKGKGDFGILLIAAPIVKSREDFEKLVRVNISHVEQKSSFVPMPLEVKTNGNFDNELNEMNDIENKWMEIQSDIVQILKYPLLADMSEPSVKNFHIKTSIARSLSKQPLGHDFVVAVSEMKFAWDSLIYEARKIELSKFNDGERKKILTAAKLMNIALNIASTPSERQVAYKKAIGQIKGLIMLPESAIQAVEQLVSHLEIDKK